MATKDWRGDDFSWIRGANHVPSYAHNDVETWDKFDVEVVDRELGYAERAGLNSVRVFFQIIVYEKDPQRYLDTFEKYLHLCAKHGIKMMPVLFDSCFGAEPTFDAGQGWMANPGNSRVAKDAWPECEKYIDDVVGRHIGDDRIAIWDIMNEPMVAGEFASKEENRLKIWRFVRHFCQYVNDLDASHPTTVGVAAAETISEVADVCGVLSFHSYPGTEEAHRAKILCAKALGKQLGKAVVISETGHYATNQRYELALRLCREEGIGWYIWELMIGNSPFPTVQGVFYPDGTIRSTADLCAVMGFERKPLLDGVVPWRGYPPEEFLSALNEAGATSTDEWNFERRLLLLHGAGTSLPLVVLRNELNRPELTADVLLTQVGQMDRAELDRFMALREELAKEVLGMLEDVRAARGRTLYRKIDEAVAALKSKVA